MAAARIIQNRDGTVTVRHGRLVAHVDTRGLTLHEMIDRVRWAAIMYGISVSEETVWAALRPDQ
jgi:hypothetical protein